MKSYIIPDSERRTSIYQRANGGYRPASELYLPSEATAGHYDFQCSTVTSGYTPLGGYQLFPLVIDTGRDTLVFQPSPFFRLDAESSDADTIASPYSSTPIIVTPYPRINTAMKLGSEGKRALRSEWQDHIIVPGQRGNTLAAVSFPTQGTNDGPSARPTWKNPVDTPLANPDAFDEVSGRLYVLIGKGHVHVHDLY